MHAWLCKAGSHRLRTRHSGSPNVLGPAKVTLSAEDADNRFGLTVNRDEGIVDGRWHFNLRMTIRVTVEHEDWIIRTSPYQYSLRERDRDGLREMLEYHWDPRRPPHVHVQGGKDHKPTGRVLLEDVLEYCIVEEVQGPGHSQG